MSNPLLAREGLPAFDRIQPEHVVPGIRTLLSELEKELGEAERRATPTWESVVEPIERLGERLAFVWGAVGHLMGVRNSPALREAHDEVEGEVVTFGLRLAQSEPFFRALERLRAGDAWATLPPSRQRIVECLLRDARLAGVALEGAARERFNAIQQELAECSTRFSNHVLDATKAFALMLREQDEVAGLPASALGLAAQAAREAGESTATPEDGPWRITLDFPSFGPFLQHARRRDLRERLYRANVTRASSGESDNTDLIARILRLRREQAALLGFEDFAALSLASKMAPGVASVEAMLDQLRGASHEPAASDLEELREIARAAGAPEADDLRPWDVAFWAERLREQRYAYSDEELREYLPFPRVLEGLFALAERLFGVRIATADGEAPVWHPDVRFFRVRDADGRPIAAFYLDPFSRPEEKRGGAWMDVCVGRAPGRLPVAHLVCNQSRPVGDEPSRMTFGEVQTLFHEFGHGLQHMLTTVDDPLAAGISNIEWDAVEIASQFMENWCYHRETVRGLSEHAGDGGELPDELFAKVLAARTFRAGSDMLRQIYFAATDVALHHGFDPDGAESAFDVQRSIARTSTVVPPIPEDRMLCSFGHIFSGGYAAGYYSYKWAEVLSADAFGAFEEAGLEDPDAVARVGRRFRDTVLALGGSRHPMEVFRAFRGREPSIDALLRQSGLS